MSSFRAPWFLWLSFAAGCSGTVGAGDRDLGADRGAQDLGTRDAGAEDGSVRADTGSADLGVADAVTPDTGELGADTGPGGDVGPARDTGVRTDGGLLVLPEGNGGLAAAFPGDEGIEAHPSVIFADDFEAYSNGSELSSRWDAVYHNADIATAPADVFGGARSLQFTSPQQNDELSNGVARTLREEQDVLFLRFHSKFDASFDVVGSSHNGGGMSSKYFVNGNATPGVPADGTNKFLIEFECWRGASNEPNPGSLNIYIYHPEQRSQWGDHFFPDGTVLPNTSIPGEFGDEFVPRPPVVPDLDRWYSYEVMLKANTPGQQDGRIAAWLDGVLIADFPNLRLRDVDTLKIDRFGLSLHTGSNPAGETRKWYDNVVVATEYIGPTAPR